MIRAVLVGAVLALSSPPHGWWPLAIVALYLLARLLKDSPAKRRMLIGFVAGFAMFSINLFWSRQFSIPGWLLFSALQAFSMMLAGLLTPSAGRWRLLAFPSALFLAEYIRITIPFGGIPIGSWTPGQADGVFAKAAVIVGEPGMVFIVGLVAISLLELRRQFLTSAICLFLIAALVSFGASIKVPVFKGKLNVALVQAGGPLGTLREDQNPSKVFADHRQQTNEVRQPVDLIVWPENVVHVNNPIEQTSANQMLANLAVSNNATLLAGVVETVPQKQFRNMAIAWNSNGEIIDIYDKVHRVPFGEYVPGRSLIRPLIPEDQIPHDAIAGTKTPVLNIGEHKTAVAISYEGLFARHVRAGVRAGGELVVIPTNAASYKDHTVAKAQVLAAQFRALESGRWVLQSAPTGLSAIVNPSGKVIHLSTIGDAAILQETINLSSFETPYVRFGDLPLLLLSVVILLKCLRQRLS